MRAHTQTIVTLRCTSTPPQVPSVPSEVLQGCVMLQTLSLHSNPITPEVLQETEGYEAYEARRRSKLDKAITGGVLLNSSGLDEGVDRQT